MVLTANQTTAFFEDTDQLVIPHDSVQQLQTEGITSAADLKNFDKDSLPRYILAIQERLLPQYERIWKPHTYL